MCIQSENVKEKLDLKKYKTSEEGYRRLIPAITKCRKAQFERCNLTIESIGILSAALQTENSLKELDISKNELQDSGMELLSAGMKSSHCKLQIVRLADCKLSKQSCNILLSVLQTKNSSLKELDLSNNDLEDIGVEALSAGLKSTHCKLEILRLSGCMITEVGCTSLASALSPSASHLKELDLTYNHPGQSGMKLLSARVEDPHCSLETLRMENGGEIRIKPGLKKYSCDLTLDPNTAHMRLSLCEGNRKVVCLSEQQEYPDNSGRFDWWEQVLCRESVTGRCFWETKWSAGWVYIALTYKTISRKGRSDDCLFGRNEKSWSLYCSNNSYSVQHNKTIIDIPAPLSSSKTVGVYVDYPAGTLYH
ncbi:ribonuclease inhibitor-like [Colossoma macropomum]|uniref:ribonuclease inhibitor-like n=1 Tax=Colossoma macropomum TaxID=42526 RepID=UPI0018649963|nr:ribonuclease inhibitor-like [Colossoma macropomum]